MDGWQPSVCVLAWLVSSELESGDSLVRMASLFLAPGSGKQQAEEKKFPELVWSSVDELVEELGWRDAVWRESVNPD